jgi:hypothetical protein
VSLLAQLAEEGVDVRTVLLAATDGGDEVAVAAPVRAEGQMEVQVSGTVHAIRLGRATSSPPQFGHTCSITSPQAAQKVHSNEQMTASPSGVTAAPQRSHSLRISRLTAAPCRC